MLNIKFQGAIYNCSGYARIRHLFLELSKKCKVRIDPYKSIDYVDFLDKDEFKKLESTELTKPYINVVSGIAPQIRPDPEAAYNIAYSMFETNTIPERWIEFYNQFDEIWTPSNFCKQAYNRRDLDCCIYVVPLGFDDRLFKPKVKENNFFTFLAVGQWIDRKGWDLLINAYTTEFLGNNEIRLCIKTNNDCKTSQEMIQEYLTTDRTSHMPRIMINSKKIDDSMMSEIYQQADVYILPSRGEGYNLPAIESLASGIPVIASDFGGHLDFLNENNSWLIPIHKLTHLSERLCKINAGYQKMWFAEPELKDIREIMRNVYDNRKKIKSKEEIKQTVEHLTWKNIAKIAENRLIEIERNL